MKVLIVVSSLQIGGEQRVVSILTDNFVKNGIDVTIFVLTKREEKQFSFNSKVKIIYGNTQELKYKNIRRIIILRDLIKKEKYSIVVGFAMIPSVLCSFAARGICPSIVTERNDPSIYPRKMKFLRYFAYHLCTAGIFQTNSASDYFPYIKNKKVIPNPISLDLLPDPYNGERNKRIVNTSRLVPEKNQKMLIAAFAKLHKKYPEYSLAFYGDGVECDNLMALGEKLGIAEKVRIYPATKDILKVIRKDSIFVLTSNHEGFPNSLAEALALGVPAISTECRIGGPNDMIKHNINGKLIPVGDTERLVIELDELMGSLEMQHKFSRNAVKLRNELSADRISQAWLTTMEGLMK